MLSRRNGRSLGAKVLIVLVKRPKWAGKDTLAVTYAILEAHYRKLGQLAHVSSILGWDEAVMMPKGGGEARAEAMATLHRLTHELACDPRIEAWLEAAEQESLGAEQRASLREMKRAYQRATALPGDLVEAQSRAQLRCEQAWRVQRKENDWAGHLPLLSEVMHLKRQEAQVLAERFGLSPYDALVETYEPGMRSAQLDVLFGELTQVLPGLVQEIVEHQASSAPEIPVGPFPVAQQRALGIEMMTALGFDFDHGRLDTSHHPFCGGVPDDVRITTRYNEADFTESLMGVLHETGHAKYEQGLPKKWRDLPVGQARSMGVHESQSLFQEMQVCRGLPFLKFAAPVIRRAFEAQARQNPRAFEADNLARLYARVRPSLIRVDADEVTYPLHVILRYRIERALIEGACEVKDIPELWDQAMQSALQLSTRGDYTNGCMQDVHWPSGAVGYFPSYTLGALIAAQLFEAARVAISDLESQIERGDFRALNAFLHARIWSRASFVETDELVREATSGPIGTDAFLRHVRRRYLQR